MTKKKLKNNLRGLTASLSVLALLVIGFQVSAFFRPDSRVLGQKSVLIADKGSDDDSDGDGGGGSGQSDGSVSSESSGSSSQDSGGSSGSTLEGKNEESRSGQGGGSEGSGSDSGLGGTGGSSTSTGTSQPTGKITPTRTEVEDDEDEDEIDVEDEEPEESTEGAEVEDEVEDDEEEGDKVQRVINEIRQKEERSEVRLGEGERIRVRTKDGRSRIDVTTGGVKTRLEFREGRVIIKAEREGVGEEELEDDTILKISERLDQGGIKVATAAGEKFVVAAGATGAVTDFPLSIDLATNVLSVNTDAGTRTLAVLPSHAVIGLQVAGIVNQIGGRQLVQLATESGQLAGVSQFVRLTQRNGGMVYEIPGLSNQRLLGFIPVAVERTAVVSAETGELVTVSGTFVNRVLDALSF